MPTQTTNRVGQRLIAVCPPRCTFHEDKIGRPIANLLISMRENGAGTNVLFKKAQELMPDKKMWSSAMGRHLHHYREVEEKGAAPLVDLSQKMGDLDILDLVIQRGAANSNNWRPTIKDTIEAMKLKTSMTGNSAFSDLIALFDGAEDEDEVDEAPEAVAEEGERESEEVEESLI